MLSTSTLPKAIRPPKVLQSSIQPRAARLSITPKRGLHSSRFLPQTKSMLTRSWESAPPKGQLISQKQYWFQAFPFWQFHVLFNSLFKVLFIFPSRYLFAIGLSPIFSFRWNIPPTLGCIPKQPDSLKVYHSVTVPGSKTGFSPSMMPCSKGLIPRLPSKTLLQTTILLRDFKFELFPLHSPLLGESWLVSFPPLINMLKFSG